MKTFLSNITVVPNFYKTIKAVSKRTNTTVRELIHGLMANFTLVSGRMDK